MIGTGYSPADPSNFRLYNADNNPTGFSKEGSPPSKDNVKEWRKYMHDQSVKYNAAKYALMGSLNTDQFHRLNPIAPT